MGFSQYTYHNIPQTRFHVFSVLSISLNRKKKHVEGINHNLRLQTMIFDDDNTCAEW